MPSFAEPFGLPSALTTLQVLLVDVGTDIWTAVAYAWQPEESSLMTKIPRHPDTDRMVSKGILVYSFLFIGVIQALMCWMLYFSMPNITNLVWQGKDELQYTDAEKEQVQVASTMYYWTLVCGQIGV